MAQNSTGVFIRAAEPDDMKLIMESWKRSWRTSPWAGVIRNDEYYASIRSTIEGLIARGAQLLVASHESKPGRVMGWVCYEVLSDELCCIHYVYVKDPFLRQGIGDQLVAAAEGKKPGLYSFRFRQVVESVGPGWSHAPEVARRK